MKSLRIKYTKRRRRILARSIAISPLTITLLGFGLILWIVFMFSVVPFSECGIAFIWTVGWQNQASLLQMILLIGALIMTSWVILLPSMLRNRRRIEAAAQAIFIGVLWVALIALKTYVLPYGTPTKSEFDRAIAHISKPRIRLHEEYAAIWPDVENWRYDYPPPPEVQYSEHPSRDSSIWRPMQSIFSSEYSPQVSEIYGARQCYLAQQEAIAQYEKDRQTLDEYWQGFRNWRAWNERP